MARDSRQRDRMNRKMMDMKTGNNDHKNNIFNQMSFLQSPAAPVMALIILGIVLILMLIK